MALISCKECGKNISSMALSCPHCGAVNKKEEEKTKGNNIVINVFIFIMLGLLTIGLLINLGDFVELLEDSWDHEMTFYYSFFYLSDLLLMVSAWLSFIYALTKKKALKITTLILLGVGALFYLIYLGGVIIDISDSYDYLEENLKNIYLSFNNNLVLSTFAILIGLRK